MIRHVTDDSKHKLYKSYHNIPPKIEQIPIFQKTSLQLSKLKKDSKKQLKCTSKKWSSPNQRSIVLIPIGSGSYQGHAPEGSKNGKKRWKRSARKRRTKRGKWMRRSNSAVPAGIHYRYRRYMGRFRISRCSNDPISFAVESAKLSGLGGGPGKDCRAAPRHP